MPKTMPQSTYLLVSLLGLAVAQHAGDQSEVHPELTTWECTSDGCVEKTSAIVLDASSRPVHQVDNPSIGCGDWGSAPNTTICPDAQTCQDNCVMEGVNDYAKYGVSTDGASLTLDMLSDNGDVLTPRVYLLKDDATYELLSLAGKEFTFDVDVSMLPCGMNGALYLSEMPADGGLSDLNKAGATYGTGYCDAQCYTTPFIAGEPNIEGLGACCNEMDIWEANSRATQIAPHPCSEDGLFKCDGADCEADGACDKNGCGYNAWRVGDHENYGPDMEVDTTRPFTVVSQYPTDDDGNLLSYRRLYIQDGRIIENGAVNMTGLPEVNYIDDEYCEATGASKYMDLGGTKAMGAALSRGMVLAMSIWWDDGGSMQWLDGGDAGPCTMDEGSPDYIRKNTPGTKVVFSNIKWGAINSTFDG